MQLRLCHLRAHTSHTHHNSKTAEAPIPPEGPQPQLPRVNLLKAPIMIYGNNLFVLYFIRQVDAY